MADAPTFRGYWAIKEALDRMQPLADWTRKFKPQQRHLTLARRDYDVMRRWPKAAHVHQIEVVGSEVWFHEFELTYDGGPRRYERPVMPAQADLDEESRRFGQPHYGHEDAP